MSTRERVIYADLLRIISIFAVIVLHVAATDWNTISINSTNWQILNIYDSLVRWCVPVFIMLSGMFFLNPEKDVKTTKIYTKYIPRIIIALIFYSFFYYVFLEIINGGVFNKEFFIVTIRNILRGDVRYHLWFLYIIIGLYIVTPIMRVFIKGADRREIQYFLLIGFIFTFLIPTLSKMEVFNKLLVLSSFSKLNINFMMGYGVYYVLGYYLYKFNINKLCKNLIYISSIISVAITIILTYKLSIITGKANDLFYGYLTPNVALMSIGVFILFKNHINKVKLNRINVKIIRELSRISFSVYLIHDAVMIFLNKSYFGKIYINPIIFIPIKSLTIFAISVVISVLAIKVNNKFKNILLKHSVIAE